MDACTSHPTATLSNRFQHLEPRESELGSLFRPVRRRVRDVSCANYAFRLTDCWSRNSRTAIRLDKEIVHGIPGHRVCASQAAADAWEYINTHPQSFIWSDDEEPASTWNRLFAADLGIVAVKTIPSREAFLQFSFRDPIVDVQLKFNREDRFRKLHGLARAVRPESDLRLCLDSTHSSDVAHFWPSLRRNGVASNPSFGQTQWPRVFCQWILRLTSLSPLRFRYPTRRAAPYHQT
jgi:hypothetical protein